QLRLVQGSRGAAALRRRPDRNRGLEGDPRDGGRRRRDRRADDADRDRAQRRDSFALRRAGRGRVEGREPADPQYRNDRRESLSGRALLVLPLRRALLSRRRKYLLRGYARRAEPRALSLGRGSLRRREPVGYGAGDGRARRADG